jgi:hypothetical protein
MFSVLIIKTPHESSSFSMEFWFSYSIFSGKFLNLLPFLETLSYGFYYMYCNSCYLALSAFKDHHNHEENSILF